MSAPSSPFVGGMRTAFPIALAYLPVAFAIGAAASGLGAGPLDATVMSALMYSGANQVFFISSLATGVPTLAVIALCVLLSLRHLLYGLVLRDRLGGSAPAKAAFAYGLTDEVFATALNRAGKHGNRPQGPWIIGLALVPWLTWVLGTLAGTLAGDGLSKLDAHFASALQFALPALFLGLLWSAVRPAVVVPMLLAGVIAGVMLWLGYPQLAIPAGGLAALAVRSNRS